VSSADILVVKGYIAVEVIKWTVSAKNPLATSSKLIALARQCKNDKYADCMLAAKIHHTTFSTRLKTAKRTFTQLIGKRLAKKLATTAPRVSKGKYKVGKSNVRTDSITPLFAFHHIKKWKLQAIHGVDDDPVAAGLLGAVECLEAIMSQTP